MDLLFDRQQAAGATLVVITHDPVLAGRCGRIVEMRDGVVVADRAA
jgi:putative ABC transport system ATP-binding protein